MTIRGWIYIITNSAMPDLVKVGYSTKDPVLRARELANTGAPRPYEVLYDALVDDPRSIESSVHAQLLERREGKEWFRCTPSEALAAIRSCVQTIHNERSNLSSESPPEMVGQRCSYSPNCKAHPARAYHNALFCVDHYRAFMTGRDASRRASGRRGSSS
jgi:hypothetical protein